MLKLIGPLVTRRLLHYFEPVMIKQSSFFFFNGKQNQININQIQNFSVSFMFLSKGKNIKKDKKKSLHIDEIELNEYFDVEKLNSQFDSCMELYKKDLIEHGSLRTSTGTIEGLQIQYDGDTYTIQDLAEIGKKNPKMYIIDMHSFPDALPVVVDKLRTSQLNLNIQQEGTKIYVPIPKVTKEQREFIAKKIKIYFNKCKDNLRSIQLKYVKKLNNLEHVSEDDKIRIGDQIKALADVQINKAEQILKTKTDELLKHE